MTEALWSDGVWRLMWRIRIMKLLGRWSLASFMKLVIDVPYYFLLVVLPVVFALALWMVLTGHSAYVQFETPVRFQLDPGIHRFVTSQHDIPDVQASSVPNWQPESVGSKAQNAWAFGSEIG
jgi:hypothetical protein